jgi:hypothetical protein
VTPATKPAITRQALLAMKPAAIPAPTPAPPSPPTAAPATAPSIAASPADAATHKPSPTTIPTTSAIVAAAPLSPSDSTSSPAPAPATKTYTDIGDNFIVSVPEQWKPGSAPSTRVALVLTGPSALPDRKAPPVFRAQVGVQQAGQTQRSIDDFSRELIKKVTRNRADSTTKIEPAKIDGIEARQFMITLEDARGMDIDMKYVVALRPPHSFVFSYLQERGLFDIEEADAIFSSIHWMKSADDAKAANR